MTNEKQIIAINIALDALQGIRHDAAVGAAYSWIARSAAKAINDMREILKDKPNGQTEN